VDRRESSESGSMSTATVPSAKGLLSVILTRPSRDRPLLKNHQQADGTVRLPKALVPYMNGVEVLKPKG